MRLAGILCTLLLLNTMPLAAGPPNRANDGPVCEIVLDCSQSMQGTADEHSSRIEMAWLALARLCQRIERNPPAGSRRPALRLAGGSNHPDNPWSPGQLVHDGNSGPLPFATGLPLPPTPMAGGLLPLTEALRGAAGHLHQRGGRRQGFILLIAAGWEGGSGNPHQLGDAGGPTAGPVIHVIGLAPPPDEARQLHQLAARSGGIYRQVGGPAGLDQALEILSGSGGIYFSAMSPSGEPPPEGSRLQVADRRGWYRRNFDYRSWKASGGQTWVPAGPYDLKLTCSGLATPFLVPSLSVERGQLTRRSLTLPEQGLVKIRLNSPAGSSRKAGSTISVLNEVGDPVYRVNHRDSCTIPLFPGSYTIRILPYPQTDGFGELNRGIRMLPRMEEAIGIELPPEGALDLVRDGEAAFRLLIEDRAGTQVSDQWPEGLLSLPEGRYRLRLYRNGDGKRVKTRRFRIKGGETIRLGPF